VLLHDGLQMAFWPGVTLPTVSDKAVAGQHERACAKIRHSCCISLSYRLNERNLLLFLLHKLMGVNVAQGRGWK